MEVNKNNSWSTTHYTFKCSEPQNDKLQEKILQMEKDGLGFQFDLAQGGGWQSDKDLLNSDEFVFKSLRKVLLNYTNQILSEIYIDDATIKIINSWANIGRKGESTMPHIHEQASWSLVYYVTHTGNANLYFKDPRILESMDRSHQYLRKPYANVIRKKPFDAGVAILFPSWLEHGVVTNMTDDIRISIACNFLIEC